MQKNQQSCGKAVKKKFE